MNFKITNNTDTVDIEAKCIGLSVSYETLTPMHNNRGLHIQIRHNRDKATFDEANRIARLLTAAPELLAFAKRMSFYFDNNKDGYEDLRELCNAAIDKATGK